MTEILVSMDDLHKRLIDRQATDELKRKAEKAVMRKGRLWTREELDYADREAKEAAANLNFE